MKQLDLMPNPFVFEGNFLKNVSRSLFSPSKNLALKWVFYGPLTLITS